MSGLKESCPIPRTASCYLANLMKARCENLFDHATTGVKFHHFRFLNFLFEALIQKEVSSTGSTKKALKMVQP